MSKVKTGGPAEKEATQQEERAERRLILKRLIVNSNVALTDFQRRVYTVTSVIPSGKVTTYGAISEVLSGSRRSARAVGQALRRNPYAPAVPCHRVLDASLQMHGFFGKQDEEALTKKAILLRKEGVIISKNGQVSKDHVVRTEELLIRLNEGLESRV